MNKSFTKAGLKKIDCISFALQIASICRHQWLVEAFGAIESCSTFAKFIHDFQMVSVISSSRRPSRVDHSVCSLRKAKFT